MSRRQKLQKDLQRRSDWPRHLCVYGQPLVQRSRALIVADASIRGQLICPQYKLFCFSTIVQIRRSLFKTSDFGLPAIRIQNVSTSNSSVTTPKTSLQQVIICSV